MKKTRLTKVLALTLVLMMVMSTTVFGATVTGKVISNTLTGTFKVQEPKDYDVVAEDFTTHNTSGVLGYNVGFKLTKDATIEDISTIEVSIKLGDTILMTNTAKMEELKKLTITDGKLSTPFDVFGTYNYNTDVWSTSGWIATGVSELNAPNNAVIKVTFIDGNTSTVINDNFTGDISKIIPDELIELSWDADTKYTKDSNGNYVITIDEENTTYDISVTATSKYMVENVLFIIECTNDDFSAVGIVDDKEVKLGEESGYWYWGPRTGFTFNRETVTTTFKVTAKPGEYEVSIYTVQLP